LLKLSDAYDKYEIKQRHSGEVSGCLSDEVDNCWKYSSDVGCAFIMLDGMSHCYALTKNEELKKKTKNNETSETPYSKIFNLLSSLFSRENSYQKFI
jgi:geranylgeranyl pyrophosphate synthase